MTVKISAITESTTAPAATDVLATVEAMTTVPVTKRKPWSAFLASVAEVTTGTDATKIVTPDALMNGVVHKVRGLVSNPQAVYAQRAQIVMMRAEAAITITRIHIACYDYSPTAELAGDLKWADDINAGGFANAAVIDVCDTTSGVKTITSGFDDATVASGKYIYFQMDASPHADIKDFYIEFYYTVD